MEVKRDSRDSVLKAVILENNQTDTSNTSVDPFQLKWKSNICQECCPFPLCLMGSGRGRILILFVIKKDG